MTFAEILEQVSCRCSVETTGKTAADCMRCGSVVGQTLSIMGYTLVREGLSESGREEVGLPTETPQHAPPSSPSR